MRIGELAALVGVSARTVRHYHHQGLLPEPARLSNGYREYSLRDAVSLVRIRRLAELGLSLDEIGDVLADDRGRELREVLLELDADLARQQAEIGAQRDRLAGLLAEVDVHPDSATVSPELATVLDRLPAGDSPFAAMDREVIKLIEGRVDPADRAAFAGLFEPLTDPAALARGQAMNARLDELAGAAPDDPRVERLAHDLADHMPDEMASALAASRQNAESARWLDAIVRDLPPAQAQVFRLLTSILEERS